MNKKLKQSIIHTGKIALVATMACGAMNNTAFAAFAQGNDEGAIVLSFPSDSAYDESSDPAVIREDIRSKIALAESLFVEGKFKPSLETDYNNKITAAKEALNNPELPLDKLAWQVYYLDSLVKSLQNPAYVLSETGKNLFSLIKQVNALDPSLYENTAYSALKTASDSARSKLNGSPTADYSALLAEIQTLYDTCLASRIDENLSALKAIVNEGQSIINTQYSTSRKEYSRDSWSAFTTAFSAAKAEVDKNGTTIDPTLATTLITNLRAAINGLVVLEEVQTGMESGILPEWTTGWDGNFSGYQRSINQRGGELYISDEKDNHDGTVNVTVTWINNGIDPLTGGLFHNNGSAERKWGEWSYRQFTSADAQKSTFLDGTVLLNGEYTDYKIRTDLTEEELLEGFTKTYTVLAGSTISLKIGQVGTIVKANSLGTYYTGESVPLDETKPEVEVLYTAGDKDKKSVLVTLKSNEALQTPEGWTKVSDTEFTKLYKENKEESITVKDLSGNETTVVIKVTGIVTEETSNKDETSKEEEKKKEDKVNTSAQMFAEIPSILAASSVAGFGILQFLKRKNER